MAELSVNGRPVRVKYGLLTGQERADEKVQDVSIQAVLAKLLRTGKNPPSASI